jgi:hypothetical protein
MIKITLGVGGGSSIHPPHHHHCTALDKLEMFIVTIGNVKEMWQISPFLLGFS